MLHTDNIVYVPDINAILFTSQLDYNILKRFIYTGIGKKGDELISILDLNVVALEK